MTGFATSRSEARYPKPPKRARKAKRPLRRKAKRKAKLRDADKLFSEYIRKRDGWACRSCGAPWRIQCAHIVSRRYRAVRWNPENALALCSKCHTFFTHRPIEWETWVDTMYPGRLGILKAQALDRLRADYDDLCKSLRYLIGGVNS
jgi:hypothetical protein